MSKAFKDWAIVCEALGTGKQSIILRKRGLRESRFCFKLGEFFLFPGHFHQQLKKTRVPAGLAIPEATDGKVEIRYLARRDWSAVVLEWQRVAALQPHHIWTDAVIRERFDYDGELAINLACVRVYRLEPVWRLDDLPVFGGCRSWIDLPPMPKGTCLQPVLSDEQHQEISQTIRAIAKPTEA